ncbi:Dual serine/threonine and tyrosine protein kinase [Halotydeus destructor]|nr:Dual serine/threonine and tyrosine protein kinase [Halotydeus destructor]
MQATLSGSTGNLPFELSKFRKYLRYLRKILNNTKGAIDDIIRSGFFTEEQLRDINLKQDDEDKIRSIIENSVGIVILGSKSWAKAAIVNELLGYQLLPVNSINGVDWRTIRLMYGQQTQVSLAVNDHYELIDHLAIYDRIWHQIPANELQINHSQDSADPGYPSATLEIKLPHHLLADDVQMIVAPSTSSVLSFEQICQNVFRNVLPIVIYAYSEADSLSAREIDDLMELKRLQPKLPVFFVCTSVTECGPQSVLEPSSTPSHADQVSAASELTESQQHVYFNDIHSDPSSSQAPPQATGDEVDSANKLEQSPAASNAAEPTASTSATAPGHSQTIFQQLTSVGFLSPPALKSPATWSAVGSKADRTINSKSKSKRTKDATVPSELVEKFENFAQVLQFSRNVLQSHLVRAASMLYTVHMACLRVFILTAFDMTRDIMITPKRIHYAKDREQQLFESLMAIANRKQEEIKDLISDTIKSMRSDLLNEAARYRFTNDKINRSTCVVGSSSFDGQDFFRTSAIGPKQDSDHSSDDDAGPAGGQSSPSSSDASARSEEMPRQEAKGDRSSDQNSSMNVNYRISPREYQNALNELQDYVLGQLNAAIAGKLVGSVDFLRDSYVGTLERCLSS